MRFKPCWAALCAAALSLGVVTFPREAMAAQRVPGLGVQADAPTTGVAPLGGEGRIQHLKAVRVLLRLINHDRIREGIPPLALDPQQTTCSLRHTRHMVEERALSHDQFPQDVCVPHRIMGENTGVWTGKPRFAVRLIHHAMMAEGPCSRLPCDSDQFHFHGHYANLLNPSYRRVGIGIVARDGVTWVTEDFTN